MNNFCINLKLKHNSGDEDVVKHHIKLVNNVAIKNQP